MEGEKHMATILIKIQKLNGIWRVFHTMPGGRKVFTVRAKPGDKIVWNTTSQSIKFILYFPGGNGVYTPFGRRLLSTPTNSYNAIVLQKAHPGMYPYAVYLPGEPVAKLRFARGASPPTIIIKPPVNRY
jgi:hypothetical protein